MTVVTVTVETPKVKPQTFDITVTKTKVAPQTVNIPVKKIGAAKSVKPL